MIKYMVKLESVSKVKEFVNTISNFDYDFEKTEWHDLECCFVL